MPKTVIVVEDDAATRIEAIDALEQAGLTVVGFDNVDHAGDYLCDHVEDVIALFFDIRLEGDLDGFGLAEIALRLAPKAILIATSGHYDDDPEKFAPGVIFLKKPWRREDIIAHVLRADRQA